MPQNIWQRRELLAHVVKMENETKAYVLMLHVKFKFIKLKVIFEK